MFRLLQRVLLSFETHPTYYSLRILETQFLRPISTTPPPPENCSSDESSSFTVSYLLNSCGLSPKSALSVSKKLHFTSPTKPDLVLQFLRNHGFSNTQIANLATKRPLVLLANPEKTLLPKLEFLKQIGFSEDGIANFLSKDPTFMCRSLERKIKPSYEYLKSLLGTDDKVTAAMKRSSSSWILQFNLKRIIGHKSEILRKYGVTEECIVKLVTSRMRLFGNNDDRFEELVRNVSEMGFDPSSPLFVYAVDVLSGMKRNTLEAKIQLFKSHGWSEDEIASAIRRQPFCVSLSEEKLDKGLDFFMNKLKWKPSEFMKYSYLLGLSLEKRVIPRWMVIQCLLSKCLIKDVKISSVLLLTEAKFLQKFLVKYESEAPEILKLYQVVSRCSLVRDLNGESVPKII
ncbi:hypothetical protein Syun_014452 [Stephania yunnanensis]|uniref:Uncharacterized protein n=1 Tax=Stephania yunnanensis TaxID=152371 RepID=A0AAP0JLP5_9MAGN